ncbi:hypothetical protein H0X32_00760 [Patescibacteria group bacterium]|nr:hypothetical protein [Patescibacteria group bacterium]
MIARILPILAILFAIGLFFGYINPTYNGQIAEIKQKIASDNSALKAAADFTQKENELIAQRNQIPSDQLARLQSYLPDGVDNIQLIIDLNSLASRSGVTLSDFNVANNSAVTAAAAATKDTASAVQSTSLTDSLDLTVSATGTYAAFRTFLAASEQSLRPMDITSFALTDSATGVYTYAITYRIYWLH